MVIPDIHIKGIQIEETTIVNLELTQQFNAHHIFRVTLYADDKKRTENIYSVDTVKEWIGERFSINMGKGKLKFNGIICNVAFSTGSNSLTVEGYSPTIIYDTESGHFETYSNIKLDDLVEKIKNKASKSTVSMNWEINNTYKSRMYLTQYDESHFAYLNRLSAIYGEFFFYDGEVCHFGKPARPKLISMEVDKDGPDTTKLEISFKILPMLYSRYVNSYIDDVEGVKFQNHPEYATGAGLADIVQQLQTMSDRVFCLPCHSHMGIPDSYHLAFDYVNIRRRALKSKTVNIKGESRNPDLNIGCKVVFTVKEGGASKRIGEFLITEVIHRFDTQSGYINFFAGVFSEIDGLPVENIQLPKASPHNGVVTQNDDPYSLGRVKVRMDWQEKNGDATDWLRVATPDAGHDGAGFSFVPMPGDEVIVGYYHGNPDLPYVMGSLFNASNSLSINPSQRTIRSREQNGLYLNDDPATSGLGLIDKNGNIIDISSSGNTITITSNDKIVLNSKQMEIRTSSLSINATNELNLETGKLSIVAEDAFIVEAGNIYERSHGYYKSIASVEIQHLVTDGDAEYMAAGGTLKLSANNDVIHLAGNKITTSMPQPDRSDVGTFTGEDSPS